MRLLPLDDLPAVKREFINPGVSRSHLDRSLCRHGVSNLNALRPKTPAEPHKTCEPGYLNANVKYLPQMADQTTRRYLFVAIDRATRSSLCASCPPRPPPTPAVSTRSAPGLSDPDRQDLEMALILLIILIFCLAYQIPYIAYAHLNPIFGLGPGNHHRPTQPAIFRLVTV